MARGGFHGGSSHSGGFHSSGGGGFHSSGGGGFRSSGGGGGFHSSGSYHSYGGGRTGNNYTGGSDEGGGCFTTMAILVCFFIGGGLYFIGAIINSEVPGLNLPSLVMFVVAGFLFIPSFQQSARTSELSDVLH